MVCYQKQQLSVTIKQTLSSLKIDIKSLQTFSLKIEHGNIKKDGMLPKEQSDIYSLRNEWLAVLIKQTLLKTSSKLVTEATKLLAFSLKLYHQNCLKLLAYAAQRIYKIFSILKKNNRIK